MTKRDPATIYGEMEPLEKPMNTLTMSDVAKAATDIMTDRRAEMLDYFAAHALQGMLANEGMFSALCQRYMHQPQNVMEHVCRDCYSYADWMLREREKWVK